MSDTSAVIERKARKSHACWWCGERITAGNRYFTWTSFDDPPPLVVKVHPECKKAWDDLPYPDNQEIEYALFNRGCQCEYGDCRCTRKGKTNA